MSLGSKTCTLIKYVGSGVPVITIFCLLLLLSLYLLHNISLLLCLYFSFSSLKFQRAVKGISKNLQSHTEVYKLEVSQGVSRNEGNFWKRRTQRQKFKASNEKGWCRTWQPNSKLYTSVYLHTAWSVRQIYYVNLLTYIP